MSNGPLHGETIPEVTSGDKPVMKWGGKKKHNKKQTKTKLRGFTSQANYSDEMMID
jgi:hypothetical protein